MAGKGLIAGVFAVFPRMVALIICAAVIAWFWGWSVLLTRRARDVGLPAWVGVGSLVLLASLLSAIKGFASPEAYGWTNFLSFIAFVLTWALWPGRGGSCLPRKVVVTTPDRDEVPAVP